MQGVSRADRITMAAAEMFLRYGYAKTTMGDIAKAAGISRPTLYVHFPGKEEAFEAAVLHLNEIRLAEIAEQVAPVPTVREQLEVTCQLWLVQVHDLQRTNPDARDMDDLSFAVVQRVYADLVAVLAGQLTAANCPLPAAAMDLARLLVFAIRGQGPVATSTAHFAELTSLQVTLFCRALGL